jgi:hypothetical protein
MRYLAEDSHSPLLSPRNLSSLPRPAQRRHASSQKPPLPLALSAPPAMPPLEPLLSLFCLPWKRCSWTPTLPPMSQETIKFSINLCTYWKSERGLGEWTNLQIFGEDK